MRIIVPNKRKNETREFEAEVGDLTLITAAKQYDDTGLLSANVGFLIGVFDISPYERGGHYT